MVIALEGHFDRARDSRLRTAAFQWLSSQSTIHGDVLPRQLLAEGFVLADDRIRLLGLQGIFKPAAARLMVRPCAMPFRVSTATGLSFRVGTSTGPLFHFWKSGTSDSVR